MYKYLKYKTKYNSFKEANKNKFGGACSLTPVHTPKDIYSICGTQILDIKIHNLETYIIPNYITRMICKFGHCTNLKSIIFEPESRLHTIGESCFEGCSGLTQMVIPSSVVSFGVSSFESCTELQNIIFEVNSNLRILRFGCFLNCSSLTEIKLPSSVITIQPCAFQSCSSLTEIEIPSSVEHIGSRAFKSCSSLIYIIFKERTDSINMQDQCFFRHLDNLLIYFEDEVTLKYIQDNSTRLGLRYNRYQLLYTEPLYIK